MQDISFLFFPRSFLVIAFEGIFVVTGERIVFLFTLFSFIRKYYLLSLKEVKKYNMKGNAPDENCVENMRNSLFRAVFLKDTFMQDWCLRITFTLTKLIFCNRRNFVFLVAFSSRSLNKLYCWYLNEEGQ